MVEFLCIFANEQSTRVYTYVAGTNSVGKRKLISSSFISSK